MTLVLVIIKSEVSYGGYLLVMRNHYPKVSVIIPARNEELFIAQCLNSLMGGTYPLTSLEVILADGCSDDNTIAVAEQLIAKNDWPLRIINNAKKTQVNAINTALNCCTGDYIARIDVHCEYPPNYIERLVEYMESNDVANVGPVIDVCPSKSNRNAVAIALAMSSVFATGRALYRVGVKEPTLVDTVPFGFFRKDVFVRYGLFDDELVRNEDQEFNHRIIRNGGKVLLVPDVRVKYFMRPTLMLLAKKWLQDGFCKPFSLSKQGGRPLAYREFVPLFFALLLLASALLGIVGNTRYAFLPLLSLLSTYAGATLFFSTAILRKTHNALLLIPTVFLAFLIIHVCFTLGYINGIVQLSLLRKRLSDLPTTR